MEKDKKKVSAYQATTEDSKPSTYFVQIKSDAGSIRSEIMTAGAIIRNIDAQDYTGEEIAVFATGEFGKIIPLKVLGPWHNTNEPLLIELLDNNGEVVISGYGTDH